MLTSITVNNLSKHFLLHQQQQTKIEVLNNLNLSINAGECVVLYGPSGLGKSTLLKCLYGNYLIEKGSIKLHYQNQSIDVATCSEQEKLAWRECAIGYVSQFLNFVPRVSTLDLVCEPLLKDGVAKKDAIEQAQNLLTQLNIPQKLWHLSPSTFSGGEQQRVNLARGFIKPVPFLLLDEPTASLDKTNRDVVITLIERAKQQGSALIGIFHDDDVRETVADKIFDLQSGEML